MIEQRISIGALIYASPTYALHMWEMLWKTTPELYTGEAEFFFVANDPTFDVLQCLISNDIPHIVQRNTQHTEQELFGMGIGTPEYMRRVYQGWNRAVTEAKHDCLVLFNSDHIVRNGWLGALYEEWNRNLALSPLTIEPPGKRHGVFPARVGGGTGAVPGKHGHTLTEFDVEGFEKHAQILMQDKTTPGGAYMPVMVSKSQIVRAGMYPEGNIHAGEFDIIHEYGDRQLFRLLKQNGVSHKTYHGVIAYHFHEGEMREAEREGEE